jgi:hypothetical protein
MSNKIRSGTAAASSDSSAPKQGTMSHIAIVHESTEMFYVIVLK